MTYLKTILHTVETIFFDGMLLLVLYSYVIPALLYLAGFEDVPRTLSVELTLYVKAIDWTYKYLLPAVGHGKVRRNRALELILYFSFCASLFGYIIPSVGRVVKEKCRGQYSCWRHMSSLPSVTGALFQGSKTYSIDLSDGQWRNLRQSLPLLGAVALAVSAVGLPIVHVLAGTAAAKSSSASADSTSV